MILCFVASLATVGCDGDDESGGVGDRPEPRSLSQGGKSDGSQEGVEDFPFKEFELGSGLEASGVVATEGGETLSVVLDNETVLLRARADEGGGFESFEEVQPEYGKGAPKFKGEAYEGLTFDKKQGLYYVLVETAGSDNEPRIDLYDTSWRWVASHSVGYEFKSSNKGMEGLAHMYHEGELHLLMLCEQNDCKESGDEGEGRVEVFALDGNRWEKVDRIKLPSDVKFKDFSGLDLLGDTIAVTSQESSAFWLGTLQVEEKSISGKPDWKIASQGEVWQMPRDNKDRHIYCNIEGVSLVKERTLFLVSDQRKPEQHDRCKALDQAFHRVVLPDTE